jgi:hypothetical protein
MDLLQAQGRRKGRLGPGASTPQFQDTLAERLSGQLQQPPFDDEMSPPRLPLDLDGAGEYFHRPVVDTESHDHRPAARCPPPQGQPGKPLARLPQAIGNVIGLRRVTQDVDIAGGERNPERQRAGDPGVEAAEQIEDAAPGQRFPPGPHQPG